MSILLDALKKSEEQRQLGKSPSIHGGAPVSSASGDSSGRWVPVALVTLSVAAMTWFGWQQMREPEGLATRSESGVVAQEPGAEEKNGSNSGAPAKTVPPSVGRRLPPSATPNRTLVESFPSGNKGVEGVTVMPPGDESAAPDSRRQVSESFRNFQGEPSNEPEPVPQEELAANAPDAAQVSEEAAPPQPRASRTQTVSESAPGEMEPISYWQLPQGIRDDMPEIKITVLVFADKPEDRFLLVNGERLVEKDEIPGGVVLDEIRRDGAVFQYRKYRFLVKG